jgi:glucose/arabinose dehydrogenase
MTLARFGIAVKGAILPLAALSVTCSLAGGAARGPAVAPVPADVALGVRLELVTEALRSPVGMTFAPKDPAKRLFVVEKGGRLRVLEKGQVLPEPYLDISSRVSGGSEQGLLGLAFHRDFVTNGRFFVNYTDKKGDTRIVEFTASDPKANRAAVSGERELLRVEQPYSNHNGGHLLTMPDGALLVGLGDGGSGGDPRRAGQDPGTLLAKMFRLDPDAKGEAAQPKILAKGVRNPWRYALDGATNDLYIADVGQNLWEEVHVTPLSELAGKNFGWNILEGSHCFRSTACRTAGLELPVVEYDHDAGCSITGGVVYRGKALPRLAGIYFYADYCTALLRSFRWKREDGAALDHWDWKAALDPKNRLSQISAFGEDHDGEVYILSLGGTIWKLAPAKE